MKRSFFSLMILILLPACSPKCDQHEGKQIYYNDPPPTYGGYKSSPPAPRKCPKRKVVPIFGHAGFSSLSFTIDCIEPGYKLALTALGNIKGSVGMYMLRKNEYIPESLIRRENTAKVFNSNQRSNYFTPTELSERKNSDQIVIIIMSHPVSSKSTYVGDTIVEWKPI